MKPKKEGNFDVPVLANKWVFGVRMPGQEASNVPALKLTYGIILERDVLFFPGTELFL